MFCIIKQSRCSLFFFPMQEATQPHLDISYFGRWQPKRISLAQKNYYQFPNDRVYRRVTISLQSRWAEGWLSLLTVATQHAESYNLRDKKEKNSNSKELRRHSKGEKEPIYSPHDEQNATLAKRPVFSTACVP